MRCSNIRKLVQFKLVFTPDNNFWKFCCLLLLMSHFGTASDFQMGSNKRNSCPKFYDTNFVKSVSEYESRILDQCESDTCWMQASITLLEKHIFDLTGEVYPISAEFLYYNLLRDRFSQAIQEINYSAEAVEQLHFDGNSISDFINMAKAHSIVGEKKWTPKLSLIQNSTKIKNELVQIWKDADAEEKRTFPIQQLLDREPTETYVESFANFRRGVLLKIEGVLKKYTGELPAKDPESPAMRIVQSFFSNPGSRIYIRENIDPNYAKRWDQGNLRVVANSYLFLPDTDYLPTVLNKTRVRDPLLLEKNNTSVNILPEETAAVKIRIDLAAGKQYYCSVLDWSGLLREIGIYTGSWKKYSHAVVISRSIVSENNVSVQNSVGPGFGKKGIVEIPLNTLLKYTMKLETLPIDSK